jgi:hypothetical protein
VPSWTVPQKKEWDYKKVQELELTATTPASRMVLHDGAIRQYELLLVCRRADRVVHDLQREAPLCAQVSATEAFFEILSPVQTSQSAQGRILQYLWSAAHRPPHPVAVPLNCRAEVAALASG